MDTNLKENDLKDFFNFSNPLSKSTPKKSTTNYCRAKKRNYFLDKQKSFTIKRCVCFPTDRTKPEFSEVWNEFRLRKQLCDGTITCKQEQSRDTNSKQYQIHRAILSGISPYFKAIFTNALNQELKEEKKDLKIDADGDLFELILDFAYTGNCGITQNNCQELLVLADRLEIIGVVQLCCHFLLDNMNPKNCLGILRFANYYFCQNLEERGKRYIANKFIKVVEESKEYKNLSYIELFDILKDDHLNVTNESQVFEALCKWLEYKMNARKKYLPKLLTCVRFGLMRFDYFNDKVLTWPPILNSKNSLRYIKTISHYFNKINHHLTNFTRIIDSNLVLSRPRIPNEILFAIGGWNARKATNLIETYDIRADRWLILKNSDNSARAYHGLVAIDNKIYLIGGFDNKYYNSVRCFDPLTQKWSEKACMYQPRCYVSVVVLEKKIYAIGGYNGLFRMNSVECYNSNINQWIEVASMIHPRSDAGAAVLNNKIYVAGGFSGLEIWSSVEVYDPVNDFWHLIEPMIGPRSNFSLIGYQDSLYAFGGFNGNDRLSSVEKYNPNLKNKGWLKMPDMSVGRSNFASVVIENLIFIIGGFNGKSTISQVEFYNPETNQWYNAHPMNLDRSGLGACVIESISNSREYSYLEYNSVCCETDSLLKQYNIKNIEISSSFDSSSSSEDSLSENISYTSSSINKSSDSNESKHIF